MPSTPLRLARSLVAAMALAGGGGRAASPPPAAATPATPLPTLVVASFDALGDRFLDRDSLPNFRQMMSDGVRAPFRPQFPSKTFPNHYSMATGLTPGEHGIVVNSFSMPGGRRISGGVEDESESALRRHFHARRSRLGVRRHTSAARGLHAW